jgi:hypothetical protein
MQTWESANRSEFLVAFDVGIDGAKIFGVFPSAEVFFTHLAQLRPSTRHAYEVIEKNSACKLYLDIEWIDHDEDPTHTHMREILSMIRSEIKQKGIATPRIYVACSSRPHAKAFKHSYHVVCPDLVFQDNSCMLPFVEHLSFMPATRCRRDVVRGVAVMASCIDLAVYTTNRAMRFPFCCKKGSKAVLMRVSVDSEAFELLPQDKAFESFLITNSESWQPFVVSDVDKQCLRIIGGPDRAGVKRPVSSHFQSNERLKYARSASSDTIQCPVPLAAIDSALRTCGDSWSRATRISHIVDTRGPCWYIQCVDDGGRACLLNPTVTHNSNHVGLSVAPRRMCLHGAMTDVMVLWYRCFGQRCGRGRLELGVFARQDGMWQFEHNVDHAGHRRGGS